MLVVAGREIIIPFLNRTDLLSLEGIGVGAPISNLVTGDL